MYEKHPNIKTPAPSTVIWRYMDLWKFLDILDKQKLYLANCKSFDDKLEGRVPINKFHVEGTKSPLKDIDKFSEKNLKPRTYVSSWNKSIDEKYPLWKIYTNDRTAVALKTTVGDLINTFSIDKQIQRIGEINYVKQKDDYYFQGNTLQFFSEKRDYFEFEKEVRILSELFPSNEVLQNPPSHIYVELKNFDFIKEVKLAPLATDSIKELIKLKLKSLKLNIPVTFSNI